jgi:hypothetical protein
MAETDRVRRFLVTAPDEQLVTFHLLVAMTLNGIERREQTVIYTCLAEHAAFAFLSAEQADVTLQELEIENGEEVYPVRRLGTHGLTWVRPSAREKKKRKRRS